MTGILQMAASLGGSSDILLVPNMFYRGIFNGSPSYVLGIAWISDGTYFGYQTNLTLPNSELGNQDTGQTIPTWGVPGIDPGKYEIRFTAGAASGAAVAGAGVDGVWRDFSVLRYCAMGVTSTTPSTLSVVIDIRHIATGEVAYTGNLNLNVNNF